MNYGNMYEEDKKQYVQIKNRFQDLHENDIAGAYQLMKDSFAVAERWEQIKYDIKKELGRGQETALKDRLEEMCRYLREISITCRMIWNNASKNLQGGTY